MKNSIQKGTANRCCGYCQYFKYEDVCGFGYCDLSKNKPETHCSDVCKGFKHE